MGIIRPCTVAHVLPTKTLKVANAEVWAAGTAACEWNRLVRCHVHRRVALVQDMQRPLYMRAADAIEYGVIDRLVPPQKASMMIDKVMGSTNVL